MSAPFFLGRVIDTIYTTGSDTETMAVSLTSLCAVLTGVFLCGGAANAARVYLMQISGEGRRWRDGLEVRTLMMMMMMMMMCSRSNEETRRQVVETGSNSRSGFKFDMCVWWFVVRVFNSKFESPVSTSLLLNDMFESSLRMLALD